MTSALTGLNCGCVIAVKFQIFPLVLQSGQQMILTAPNPLTHWCNIFGQIQALLKWSV